MGDHENEKHRKQYSNKKKMDINAQGMQQTTMKGGDTELFFFFFVQFCVSGFNFYDN